MGKFIGAAELSVQVTENLTSIYDNIGDDTRKDKAIRFSKIELINSQNIAEVRSEEEINFGIEIADMIRRLDDLTDRVIALEASISSLSTNLDNTQDAVLVIATKLDGEDVTNLDTDYVSSVNAVL